MSEELPEKASEVDARVARSMLVLCSVSGGFVIGAVVLAALALVWRSPRGSTGTDLSAITTFTIAELVGVVVVALVTGVLLTALMAGTNGPHASSYLGIAIVVAMAAAAGVLTAVFASWPDRAFASVSGPGDRGIREISIAAWIALTVGCIVVVAVVVRVYRPDGTRRLGWPAKIRWAGVSARPATLLVAFSMVVGLVVAASPTVALSITARDPARAAAENDPVPGLPTTLGERISYSFATEDPSRLVAAGAGFVVENGTALEARDGGTGRLRWTFAYSRLPSKCTPYAVHSTGVGPGSSVVLACLMSGWPSRSMLIGLDAMSGEYRWSNGENWRPDQRLEGPAHALAVVRGDELMVLDPRTGNHVWHRSVRMRCTEAYPQFGTTTHAVVYLVRCGTSYSIEVHSISDASVWRIPLRPRKSNATQFNAHMVAVFGDSVVTTTSAEYSGDGVYVVDTARHRVRRLPGAGSASGGYTDTLALGTSTVPVVELSRTAGRGGDYVLPWKTEITPMNRAIDNGISADRRSAMVGDGLATATVFDPTTSRVSIAIVDRAGNTTRRPSPCGYDAGGLLVVPGATLMICARETWIPRHQITYHVLGLR
ncbi:hypothetical protein [Gordonia soli]|uniref:hypothetical protein n=1 Tax=Gordonia soli TaxID=320799 RepID=UPI00034BBE14|nr:hypothetical protein [Gordonia soli]